MAHNTMERITIRVPDKLVDRIDRLVESGEYPNRSEVLREGVRDVAAKYDFDQSPPKRRPGPSRASDTRGADIEPTPSSSRSRTARTMTQVYRLRSLRNGDEPFIVFDATGGLDRRMLPDDVVIASDATEFRKAIREIDG